MSSAETRALRVVIADDDAFTLSLVRGGLEAQGYAVTATTSVAHAIEAVRAIDPHAVISDLNFGTAENGADLLRFVADEFPWVGLVVLTSHRSPELAVPDPQRIPRGAVYLVKSQLGRIDELADAVQRAISGAPDDHADLFDEPGDDGVPSVTAAQAEVLRMLAAGASTRALAEARGTTTRAVETMLHRLFVALGLDTSENANPRVAAVTMWQRGGVRVR